MNVPEDGLILVVKEDCPTCQLVVPLLHDIRGSGVPLTVFSQDNSAFPTDHDVVDDRSLEASFELGIEIVPTLIARRQGRETGRTIGWSQRDWSNLTGIAELGSDLPPERPGCGSLTAGEGVHESLVARYGEHGLRAASVAVSFPSDPVEMAFERGWTDGLPVVLPTPERVLYMLTGTTQPPDRIIGKIPPSGVACTVEKLAINAVMAGCTPACFPVVLTALEAALETEFAWQGLLSTTMGAGVCIVVSGPIARRAGLNAGFNALGHGNRANATISRALLLTAINIGGVRPGGLDRSTHGHPGKHGLCFAEDESDSGWTTLATANGFDPGRSALTVFGFCGSVIMNDESARDPVILSETLGHWLHSVVYWRDNGGGKGAMLILGGEFWNIYKSAGCTRARIEQDVRKAAGLSGRNPSTSPQGNQDMHPTSDNAEADDLLIVRAGSNAGLFATILPGWGSGPLGSQHVTREVIV